MTEDQKPQEKMAAHDDAAEARAAKAKTALAEAVSKRTEARKLNDKSGSRTLHGGRPISNVKVSDQIRGK